MIPVSPASIEDELGRIRRKTDEESRPNSESEVSAKPVARAVLSNVLLVRLSSKNDKTQHDYNELIESLCITHPSRFFVVTIDASLPEEPEGGAVVESAVSSRCVIARSGAYVCSEEVYLRAHPTNASAIANLLLSLMVADVPTVLLLLSDPTQTLPELTGGDEDGMTALLQSLKPICDHVVYDSGLFSDYRLGVAQLLSLAHASVVSKQLRDDYSPIAAVRDVVWLRAVRWRALIAERFDAETFSGAVDSISSIEFVSSEGCGALRDVSADALLLGGWLLDSLNAVPLPAQKQDREGAVLCASESAQLAVSFRSEAGRVPEHLGRMLVSVTISLTVDGAPTTIHLTREGEGRVCAITVSQSTGSGDVELFNRRMPFPASPLEDTILASITDCGRDACFAGALQRSTELATAFADTQATPT